jgi:ABC-2 type transport system ATP-binding protein
MTIEVSDLRKNYGAHEVLRGLTFDVQHGSIHAFLGRNGAGKTTTLKILLGMTHPTSGRARVFGLDATDKQDSVAIRERTAFVDDEKDLPANLTVQETILFTQSFYPKWRSDLEQRYFNEFGLRADQKVKQLSRGTKTKLALLLAFARGADLLILDEPTSGLDPVVSEEILQALVRYTSSLEATVFFSSHQLTEVEQVADHVTILHQGQAFVSGSLDDVRENYRRIQAVFDGDLPTVSAPGIVSSVRQGRTVSVLASSGAERIVEHVRGLGARSVDVAPVTLKEVFLETVTKED